MDQRCGDGQSTAAWRDAKGVRGTSVNGALEALRAVPPSASFDAIPNATWHRKNFLKIFLFFSCKRLIRWSRRSEIGRSERARRLDMSLTFRCRASRKHGTKVRIEHSGAVEQIDGFENVRGRGERRAIEVGGPNGARIAESVERN